MASSNRHWPSMFKSKPSNPNHQFQHDINSSLMSTGCHRSPYTSGCDEKSPEPKPRWNPKPEQIRILEAIFNSGMVNPPREEIRKIRIQLQEYGQVGDANVFYWFQNRKSRSKHKLRHLNNTKNQNSSSSSSSQSLQNPANSLPQFTATNNNSSSSSSSEKSSPKEMIPPNKKGFSIGFSNVTEVVPNSPTASVNQTYFQAHNETNLLPPPPEPFFPWYHNGQGGVVVGTNNGITTQGYGLSEISNVIHQGLQPYTQHGPCTNLLLSEIMSHGASSKKYQDHQDKDMKIMNQQHSQFISFCQASTPTTNVVVPSITNTTVTVPSPITQLQDVSDAAGTAKSTVFINDVAFEFHVGPFNVREAFGDEAVLIQSSGHPVLTDDWGVTLHPLQHGASYYLI